MTSVTCLFEIANYLPQTLYLTQFQSVVGTWVRIPWRRGHGGNKEIEQDKDKVETVPSDLLLVSC